MRLPEVREKLYEIANDPRLPPDVAELLTTLGDETKRRYTAPAATVSATITPELIDKIIAYNRANPGTAQTQIGRLFNVNQGRVSEILKGVRE